MTDTPAHEKQKHNHLDDKSLISYLRGETEKAAFGAEYVKQLVGRLRAFSAWCRATGRPQIAGRLNELDEDVQSFEKVRGAPYVRVLRRALRMLRKPELIGFTRREPYYRREAQCAEDRELIRELSLKCNLMPETIQRYQRALRGFSDWLYENGKQPMAGRLHHAGLEKDVREFHEPRGYSRPVLPAIGALRASSREQGGLPAGGGSSQQITGALSSANAKSPSAIRDHGSSASRARSRSLDFRQNAPPPPELDQGSVPTWRGEREADFGAYVPVSWRSGYAPPPLIAELRNRGLLPDLFRRTDLLINGMRYTASMQLALEPVTPYHPQGLQIELTPGGGPFGLESQSRVRKRNTEATARNPMSDSVSHAELHTAELQWDRSVRLRPDQPDGQVSGSSGIRPQHPLVLGSLEWPDDEHISADYSLVLGSLEWLDDEHISADYSLVLGSWEWLGDEHISADYSLVRAQFQRENPDLAARTRFVLPSQVQLLRLSEEVNVRREIVEQVMHDAVGNDTADFLFLPLSNAGADLHGNHWSLLFVDRSQRENPVAYHYDSSANHGPKGEVGWQPNGKAAEQLANRLDVRLQPAPIANQSNKYDCGVFVVDATRALAARLAQGERPAEGNPLRLSHLMADRRSLQERLKHAIDDAPWLFIPKL